MTDNETFNKLAEIEHNLVNAQSQISEQVQAFNEMRKQYIALRIENELDLPDETFEDGASSGLGRAAKYWGISRSIMNVLINSDNAITSFTVEKLRDRLPNEFRDAPTDTIVFSLNYIKTNLGSPLRPNVVSLNALPTKYALSNINGKFTFYNYKLITVKSGRL